MGRILGSVGSNSRSCWSAFRCVLDSWCSFCYWSLPNWKCGFSSTFIVGRLFCSSLLFVLFLFYNICRLRFQHKQWCNICVVHSVWNHAGCHQSGLVQIFTKISSWQAHGQLHLCTLECWNGSLTRTDANFFWWNSCLHSYSCVWVDVCLDNCSTKRLKDQVNLKL